MRFFKLRLDDPIMRDGPLALTLATSAATLPALALWAGAVQTRSKKLAFRPWRHRFVALARSTRPSCSSGAWSRIGSLLLSGSHRFTRRVK